MAWRDQNEQEYDPHGGRNAFRNTHDDYESSSDRAASFRAMRSFTESIECDLPPAPELPPQLDIDQISMKTSDTNDTIIEVIKPATSVYIYLSYRNEEHELHKSLIRDDDEELDGEIGNAMATEISEEQKIKVSIPSKERSGEKFTFYNFNLDLKLNSRGIVSGRTTPLNDYDGDILEENPRYKDRDDDEPTFSEDMSEEREKFKSTILNDDQTLSQTSDIVNAHIPDSAKIIPVNTNEHVVPDVSFSTAVQKSLCEDHDDSQNEQVGINYEHTSEVEKQPEQGTEQEQYDPHGYPGKWMFPIIPCFIILSILSTKMIISSGSEGQQYDYTQQGYDSQAYYDNTQKYNQASYGSVQNSQYQSEGCEYPADDQINRDYDQNTTGYDQNLTVYSYGQTTTGYGYDQSTPGYEYDQSATAYGYDQTTPGYGYDQTTPGYGYDQGTTGYGYDQTTPGYGYDQTTPGYGCDQGTTGYSYDQNITYDQTTSRFDENSSDRNQTKVECDQSAMENPPTPAGYDQDQNYQYNSANYTYNQQKDQEYSQPAADGAQYEDTEYSYNQNDQGQFADYIPHPQSVQFGSYQQDQSNASSVLDPYAWNAQESMHSMTSTEMEDRGTGDISSKHVVPTRPPPPSRPAPPKLPHTGEDEQGCSARRVYTRQDSYYYI
uniref:CUB domain-containing protein n=1 Tax=Heterorhabditis bacteriophora TaxID=37862 RepID=A0A1I7XFG3_HETBA